MVGAINEYPNGKNLLYMLRQACQPWAIASADCVRPELPGAGAEAALKCSEARERAVPEGQRRMDIQPRGSGTRRRLRLTAC